MRCRRQPLQDTGLSEQQRACADGHEGALFARVGDLELCECFDQFEGFRVVFEDRVDAIAAGDDEDVVFLQVFVGGGEVNVGFDGEAG